MTGYKVNIRQACINEETSEEEFGSWSSEHVNTLESVELGSKYPDIVSTLSIKQDEQAFVVWVEYSSGDSFGQASRGSKEAVGIFKDRKPAEELKEAIEAHNPDVNIGDWENKYKLKLTTSDGQNFDIYTGSWHDYFGGLDEVHVDRVIID